MSTLHILNGDATLTGFNNAGLDGDVLVWREVLSEGPLSEKLDTGFWKMRSEFISQTFDDTPEHYMEQVVGQLEKLNNNYSEFNLWFEFDLHCQVNLLGAMQVLKQQTDLTEPAIYLICPDSYPDIENFKGMGELDGDQLGNLFDNRVQLTEYDFTLAAEAWTLYLKHDSEALKQWIESTPFWGSLHMLKNAMLAQVKRLQKNEQGYNYVEQRLLNIYNTGITNQNELYQKFWAEDKIYGMGDRELDIYLKRLGINLS